MKKGSAPAWKNRGLVGRVRAWNARRRARAFDFAVLAMMKNESLNLDEWIDHYLWQGADRIFLIDNGSTDGTFEKACAWAERAPVSVIARPGRWDQIGHYWSAYRHFRIRRDYKWLLIADLDEFWFCPDGRPLLDVLTGPLNADVIYANWRLFGTGGHVSHPDSLRRRLVMRQPGWGTNRLTKFICRTKILRKKKQLDVHRVAGACSRRVMPANGLFQLNHYQVQSAEFWNTVKVTRGDAAIPHWETRRQNDGFLEFDRKCTVEDRRLADLLDQAEAHRREVGSGRMDRPA